MTILPYSPGACIAPNAETINEMWNSRIEAFAHSLETAWAEFDTLTSAIDEQAGDLPADELATIFPAFEKLVRLGVRFDPRFILTMNETRQDALYLDIDTDHDTDDEKLDLEDSDEDGSMEQLEDDGFFGMDKTPHIPMTAPAVQAVKQLGTSSMIKARVFRLPRAGQDARMNRKAVRHG